MASIVAEQLNQAGKAFFSDDKNAVELLRENEKAVDSIHEKAGNYLHKISTLMLNEKDRAKKERWFMP
jgi:Na+/phosphate symporter